VIDYRLTLHCPVAGFDVRVFRRHPTMQAQTLPAFSPPSSSGVPDDQGPHIVFRRGNGRHHDLTLTVMEHFMNGEIPLQSTCGQD
jgi:hypothetical protein